MLRTSRTLTIVGSKIKVDGFAAYYGNAGYISVYIKLMYKGKPFSTPTVRLNNSIIRNSGNGEYHGALTPYNNIKVGNELIFTAELSERDCFTLSDPPFKGKIVLATHRISNIIKWVYPKPRQVININNVIAVPLRWDFTGTPKPTELFIKDVATNTKILSKIISNESLMINASLFKPGKTYRMGLWAYAPLENFKVTNICDTSSKVVFYFSDILTFKTGTKLSVFKPVYRKR
jgi:hypothetical protein